MTLTYDGNVVKINSKNIRKHINSIQNFIDNEDDLQFYIEEYIYEESGYKAFSKGYSKGKNHFVVNYPDFSLKVTYIEDVEQDTVFIKKISIGK